MISGRPRPDGAPIAGELAEDVVVVRAAYRALEEDDGRGAARYLDPRVEWVDPAVTRFPFDGVRCGLPAVLRAAFRRGDGANPRFSADTFLEFGDGVLVAGRFVADDGSGEPFLHECFVRGGRILCVRGYPV